MKLLQNYDKLIAGSFGVLGPARFRGRVEGSLM